MTHSKYHTPTAPFSGADAFAIAMGQAGAEDDELKAEPPPNGVDRVTSGHERLCIDCRFCTDNGSPDIASLWTCHHPLLSHYDESGRKPCITTRWLTMGFYEQHLCGPDGTWFQNAEAD